MGEMKKISLTEGTEVELRGLKVIVYSPVFDKYIALQDKFSAFEKMRDTKKQTKAAIDMLYDMLSEDNKDLTKEVISAKFTMEAFIKIIQIAFGMVQE